MIASSPTITIVRPQYAGDARSQIGEAVEHQPDAEDARKEPRPVHQQTAGKHDSHARVKRRGQSSQRNNRMLQEAQCSKKGAPRPLAKLLIHHESRAARWAFLNLKFEERQKA
jgi:hypothetical protein